MTDDGSLTRIAGKGAVPLGPPRSLEGGRLTRQDFQLPSGTLTLTITNWERPKSARKPVLDDDEDEEEREEREDAEDAEDAEHLVPVRGSGSCSTAAIGCVAVLGSLLLIAVILR